jgi:hypothetical protein
MEARLDAKSPALKKKSRDESSSPMIAVDVDGVAGG